MTGARKFAKDYIHPLITSPQTRLLDVCCGDRWIKRELPTCIYEGLDIKTGQDLRVDEWWRIHLNPTLIVSCYGLQHLMSEEARVWTLLRRIASDQTKFVYIGRWAAFPIQENDRADPLNGYNRSGFSGLALASGWHVADFKPVHYEGDNYRDLPPDYSSLMDVPNPNAFGAILEPLV